jgi:hypothetical protein
MGCGRFVMLLPRELDKIAAGRHMPSPAPKPKIPEVQVNKHDKGKLDPAKSDEDSTAATKAAPFGKGLPVMVLIVAANQPTWRRHVRRCGARRDPDTGAKLISCDLTDRLPWLAP